MTDITEEQLKPAENYKNRFYAEVSCVNSRVLSGS